MKDILGAMQQVMGPLPKSPAKAPRVTAHLAAVDLGSCTRLKIAYEPEPGDEVPAYLFLPHAPGRKRAARTVPQPIATPLLAAPTHGGYVVYVRLDGR